MRFSFLLLPLTLAACNADPNDNGETAPRPGYEQCASEHAAETEQKAQPITGGSRVGGAMAGAVGAVFTAPLCLLFHP